MAGRGPAPKAQHQRERDTRRRQDGAVHLEDDGALRGPDFPLDVVPSPHPATVEWWDTWRRSPMASLFLPTDWQVLKRAARLQDDVMSAPRASAAAVSELRLIEERLGATYVDRQRAKITVAGSDGSPSAPVTPLRPVDSRDRLAARLGRPTAPSTEAPPF